MKSDRYRNKEEGSGDGNKAFRKRSCHVCVFCIPPQCLSFFEGEGRGIDESLDGGFAEELDRSFAESLAGEFAGSLSRRFFRNFGKRGFDTRRSLGKDRRILRDGDGSGLIRRAGRLFRQDEGI